MEIRPREDAKYAIDIIEGERNLKDFSDYYRIWSFATENLTEMYNPFVFNDKNVLTICSSGDHLISAVSKGAKNVDCFDLNILTIYYLYLKIGAINALSYNDFVDYFLNSRLNYFSYQKIRRSLTPEIQEFWEIVFRKIGGFDPIFDTRLFIRETDDYNICQNVPYINRKSYEELKEKLTQVKLNFIHSSLIDLPNNLNQKYDLMFLSNLNYMIDQMFEYPSTEKYKIFIRKTLAKFLAANGEIAMAYLYSTDHKYFIDACKNMAKIGKVHRFFPAFGEESATDTVIIYKKEKGLL